MTVKSAALNTHPRDSAHDILHDPFDSEKSHFLKYEGGVCVCSN